MADISKRTLSSIKEEVGESIPDKFIALIYNAGYKMGLKARSLPKDEGAPRLPYLNEE